MLWMLESIWSVAAKTIITGACVDTCSFLSVANGPAQNALRVETTSTGHKETIEVALSGIGCE